MNEVSTTLESYRQRIIMKTFTIDTGNNVTAYVSKAEAAEACSSADAHTVTSESEFQELALGWPAARLTALWNTLPGVTPVRRFTDRTTAVRRIWNAIQRLEPTPIAAEKALPAGDPHASPVPHPASKKAQVLAMLGRPGGATLHEIMAIVSWQAHTVRGFLSGTVRKRMGLGVAVSRRTDGQRAYHVQAKASELASSDSENKRRA